MNKAILIFTVLIFLATSIRAQVFKSETGHAEFKSSVPLHSFVGSSDHLVGKINRADGTVDFYLDLTTLDTGNSKRDKDMRETLNTDEYPFAEFYGKFVSGFDSTSKAAQQVRVNGEFKIHNVVKNVTIEGTLSQTGEGLKVEAAWTLNLKDYDIEPPGILFYRVDEEVSIKVIALLKSVEE